MCACVRLRMHRYMCIFMSVHVCAFLSEYAELKSEQSRWLLYPHSSSFLDTVCACVCVCVHLCMNISVCIFVCVSVSAGLNI